MVIKVGDTAPLTVMGKKVGVVTVTRITDDGDVFVQGCLDDGGHVFAANLGKVEEWWK